MLISENLKSPDIVINLPSFTEKEVLRFLQKQEAQGEVTLKLCENNKP